jgi:hypothetical protein
MKNTCIRCLALKYEKFVGKIRCSYEMHSFHFTILFVKCWWVKHWDIKWRGLSSIWYDICILPLDKPCLIILKKKNLSRGSSIQRLLAKMCFWSTSSCTTKCCGHPCWCHSGVVKAERAGDLRADITLPLPRPGNRPRSTGRFRSLFGPFLI